MAITIITTPGAADANAYATVAEVAAYCEAHVDGAAFAAADAEKQKAAIVQATRQLDAYIDWLGGPTTTTQALGWPRCGMYAPNAGITDPTNWRTIASTEIPTRLKNACAEQALQLLAGDRAKELDQQVQGLSSLSVGGGAVALGFQASALPRQVIAPAAWAFVSWWGTMRQTGRGGAVALQRA